LYIRHIPGGLPVQDAGHLLWVHPDAVGSDNESKVLHLLLVEVALLRLKVKTSIRERLQHLVDLLLVFLQGVAIDEDVIKEGSAEVVEELAEYIIDQVLEVSWRIGKAEWYYQRFKKAIPCPEGCFPFLSLGRLYQVVGITDVQGGEVFGLRESYQRFLQ